MHHYKAIGVDHDDVLFPYNAGLIEFHNRKHGTHYRLSDLTSYNQHEFWGGSREQDIQEMLEYQAELFALPPEAMSPISGAYEILSKLSRISDLVLLTARSEEDIDYVIKLIQYHFPNIFKDFVFANHMTVDGPRIPKSVFCKKHGIELLIDDLYKHLLDCAMAGIDGILFGNGLWNGVIGELHPRVRHAPAGWRQVGELLLPNGEL